MAQSAPIPPDKDALVAHAQAALQSGKPSQAVQLCEQLLQIDPNHQDALYTCAVAQRMQRQFAQALALTDRLLALDPTYGRAHQEAGHCHRDMGNSAAALACYKIAVTQNAALAASWKMLAQLHDEANHEEGGDFAASQYEYLQNLPPALLSVASLIQEGRFLKAEKICRHFLQTNGHNIDGMRMLAEIGSQFNNFDEAEFLLESCVVLEPDHSGAHYDYVNVLHKRQKFAQALEQAAALRQKEPGNPQVDLLFANENLAVGNFDVALEIYHQRAAEAPNNPNIHLTLGHALKTIGRQSEAIEAYSQAYQVRADFGDAYWSLANLKTYRFTKEQIASMRVLEAGQSTALADRYHLCFAIGKALEDRGDYAVSFEYYERGNRLKREEVRYDWTRISNEIGLQIDHCTPTLFAAQKGSGSNRADPIFIVGLPRAGSTLLEQILASHSQVEGTMELPNILALAHRLDGRRRIHEEARYPANLAELSRDELREFGEAFVRNTQIHRKSGTPFFIDKMPNNFRHIGLIHLILPNAKIIDARRGAMGCCFSGFKQLFAEGQEFTYGLEEIGHYYRDYVALMDHWDRVLPGKVLRVHYGDVVADLETQVRRILDYIGLPFEAACLDFHSNDRAVRTASSEQVRQPIFTAGLDQWENFAPYLGALTTVLGPELAST